MSQGEGKRTRSSQSCSLFCLQIRALLRPVDPDTCSTSSRSRSTSEDSVELRTRNHQLQQPNGLVVIDPLLCSKNLTQINDNNGDNNVSIDKTLHDRSVCETVAEVTENVTVSEVADRDSAEKTNNNVNHIDHSNSNGEISSTENHVISENGDIRNGHHLNGDVNENDTIAVNGDMGKPGLDNEICGSSDQLDNDKENNSYLENGSCDSSIDEEVANDNTFLKLVDDEAEILTKEREYFLTLLDEATATSEEGNFKLNLSSF